MEGSDVFAQDIGAGDDPFADNWDPANSEVAGPGTESDSFEKEIPIVDREGAPVAAPAEGASAESQADERPAPPPPAPAPAESAQVPTQDPPPQAPAPAAAAPAANGGAVEAPAAPAPTPAEPVVDTPADSTPSAAAEPTAAGEPPSEEASATGELESDSNDDDAAAPPTEAKGKRRYYVLRVEGQGKLTQLFWYEDSKGKMVPKGTQGAKRQSVALARGAEEALKIGFAAAGAPAEGVTLIPIAALHYQAKKVKPAPPEPSRVRLQIS